MIFFIDFMTFVGVYKNIPILIAWLWFFQPHPLMPTMHSADWIRMNSMSDILMNSAIFPKANSHQKSKDRIRTGAPSSSPTTAAKSFYSTSGRNTD